MLLSIDKKNKILFLISSKVALKDFVFGKIKIGLLMGKNFVETLLLTSTPIHYRRIYISLLSNNLSFNCEISYLSIYSTIS